VLLLLLCLGIHSGLAKFYLLLIPTVVISFGCRSQQLHQLSSKELNSARKILSGGYTLSLFGNVSGSLSIALPIVKSSVISE
jgi:hypothetical protein